MEAADTETTEAAELDQHGGTEARRKTGGVSRYDRSRAGLRPVPARSADATRNPCLRASVLILSRVLRTLRLPRLPSRFRPPASASILPAS
jgi:hypothetical protein